MVISANLCHIYFLSWGIGRGKLKCITRIPEWILKSQVAMCIPHQEKMLSIIHFLFSRNVMLLFCKFRGLFLSYLKHSLTHFKLHMDRNDLSKREGTQAFLTTICHLNIIHTKDMTTSIVNHVVLSYYDELYTPQCDGIEIIGA